jgi:hypothetical protein
MALMSFAEYAKHRGVSKAAVTKAVQAGRISTEVDETGKRKINPEVADREWKDHTQADKLHIPTQRERKELTAKVVEESGSTQENYDDNELSPDDPDFNPFTSFTKSRALKEHYNANLARLEYEEKIGKLVSAEEVKNAAFKRARAVRDGLLALPDRLSAEMAAETNQFRVHARLTEEIRKVLRSLDDNG